jgi:hypothetical protein
LAAENDSRKYAFLKRFAATLSVPLQPKAIACDAEAFICSREAFAWARKTLGCAREAFRRTLEGIA